MKKLIFLLLFPFLMLAQNPTNFPYGIKNTAATTDNTPAYFVTSQTDGVHKKTPAALIALKSDLPVDYAKIVYVNATDPNSATIFSEETPPVVNDPLLDNETANLYIGTDASTWVYNGSTYVTKSVPASSNYYIEGTNTDAGNSKTANIQRTGGAVFGNYLYTYGELVSKKGGSDTANLGSAFRLSNNAGSENNTFQLNASNGVDLWNYASGSWNKRFTFSSSGKMGIGTSPSFTLDLGNNGGNIIHIGDTGIDSFISPTYWDTYGTDFGFFTHGIYNIVFSPQGTGRSIFSMGDVNISAGNLTVSGTVAATSYTGSATLTGTPTAPTATAGTNTTQIATTAFVLANSNPIPTTTNTNIGLSSIGSGSGINNSNYGYFAGANNSLSGNTAIGAGSIRNITTGNYTIGIGYDSGLKDSTVADLTSATESIFIGTNTRAKTNVTTNEIVIGYAAEGNGSNTVTLGNNSISKTVLKGVINTPKTYTVATLPTGVLGDFTIVTDATAPTYLGTLTGGGSVVCPVFYNGTAWVAH